jgi:hypothetical protein
VSDFRFKPTKKNHYNLVICISATLSLSESDKLKSVLDAIDVLVAKLVKLLYVLRDSEPKIKKLLKTKEKKM